MAFERLARVEEVPAGESRLFLAAGDVPVVIVNSGGRLHALSGLCPHQLFALEGAFLDCQVLVCPHHNYGFDISTGENTYPGGREGLATYPVEIRDREVWVDIISPGGVYG